jgi:hypothetical protein
MLLGNLHLNPSRSPDFHLMVSRSRLPTLGMVNFSGFARVLIIYIMIFAANWTDWKFHNQAVALPMLPPEMLLGLPNAMTSAVDIWALTIKI